MFFLFYKFLFFISDLLEIQRKSFYKFLNFQLKDEIAELGLFFKQPKKTVLKKKKRNVNISHLTVSDISYPYSQTLKEVIENKIFSFKKPKFTRKTKEMDIFFLYDFLRYTRPSVSIEESILLARTYSCNFYIPIQINTLTKWIFLGSLPLLTRRGHFIVNGIPRVVVNQIVRSPGVYFLRELRSFYSEIISERGPWIRVDIDKKKQILISLTTQQEGLSKMNFSQFFENYYPKYIDFLKSQIDETYLNENTKTESIITDQQNILKKFQLYGLHSKKLKKFKFYLSHFLNFRIFIKCKLTSQFKRFKQKSIEKKFSLKTSQQLEKPKEKPKKKKKNSISKYFIEDVDIKNTDIEDTDIEDTDIEDTDIEDIDIEDTDKDFDNIDFQNLEFENIKIENIDFLKTNFSTSYFDPFGPTDSDNIEFQNRDFNDTEFISTDFEDTDEDTDFDYKNSNTISFQNINLNFQLGNLGRSRLNKKLGLTLKTEKLTSIDFLSIANTLIKLSYDFGDFEFDDIDDLRNRKVKSIGDLLRNQLVLGFQRFQKIIKTTVLKKFPIPVKTYTKSLKKKKKKKKKSNFYF